MYRFLSLEKAYTGPISNVSVTDMTQCLWMVEIGNRPFSVRIVQAWNST